MWIHMFDAMQEQVPCSSSSTAYKSAFLQENGYKHNSRTSYALRPSGPMNGFNVTLQTDEMAHVELDNNHQFSDFHMNMHVIKTQVN